MKISRVPRGKPAQKTFVSLFVVLSLMAILSILALDYVFWKKGEKAYLFPFIGAKKKPPRLAKTLSETLFNNLIAQGFSPDSIHHYEDEEKISHLKIELPLERFQSLGSALEKEILKEGAQIAEKGEEKGKERIFYLWKLRGKKGDRLHLLFSCSVTKPEKREIAPKVAPKMVAIIVDDMGYSLEVVEQLYALKQSLTISVLPFSPLAMETANLAREKGLEVMLHLPLESHNSQEGNNYVEGMIHSGMNEEEVKQTLEESLQQIPSYRGVNNHMGSKITENEAIMRTILSVLKEKALFFVDSRTSSRSLAFSLAQRLGIPSASRDIFLDTEKDENSIKQRLIELFRLAEKKGSALGICHPTEPTLNALRKYLPLIKNYGVEMVYVSKIVR